MGGIPRVKVINQKEDFMKTEYYINDQKIERVKSVDFHVGMGEAPAFDFAMFAMPDIDILSDVRFSFTPETVDEAVVVLRNELLKHGTLYDAFISSIGSAIKDFESSGTDYDISETIVKRIIGEE